MIGRVTAAGADYYYRAGLTWVRSAQRSFARALPTGAIFVKEDQAAFAPTTRALGSMLASLQSQCRSISSFKLSCSDWFGLPEFVVGVIQRAPCPRPHACRRGRPRLARPPRLVAQALASTPGPRRATPSSCRRCSRRRAARSPPAPPPGPSTSRRSTPSSRRSRPRSTSAASPCTASTRRTAAPSPRASAGAAPTPRPPRTARTPTPTTRPRRRRRPTPRPSPPSSFLGRRRRVRPVRRPARHRCPRAGRRARAVRSAAGLLARDAHRRRRPAARLVHPPAIRFVPRGRDPRRRPGPPARPHRCRPAVFDTVFGASADAIWQEASALLDPKGHDLRTWLAKEFFAHHLARHSKSRRKAPILWQLGPASARYSAWLLRPPADPRQPVRPRPGRRRAQARARGAQAVGPRPGGRSQPDRQAAGRASPPRTPSSPSCASSPTRSAGSPRSWNPDLDDGIVLVSGAPLAPRPAQALGQGAQEPLGRPRRRQVRLGASRDAPLARAGRAQVRHRPQPGHRPRARGGLLGRGCRRQVDQAGQAHPTGRGARRRAHLRRRQGCPRGPAGGTGAGSQVVGGGGGSKVAA